MVLIEKDQAAAVASRESGTTNSASVVAGIKTAPFPSPANAPRTAIVEGLVGFVPAKPPVNAAVVLKLVSEV